jgi:uncharacterized repeat protein (TIGR01451 family)
MCTGVAQTMTTAPLSLCSWPRHRVGAWIRARSRGACRALAACLAAASVSIPVAGSAQFADWAASKGVRLDALLEKVVESKGPDGAVRYDLAPGVVSAGGGQFVLTLRFTNTTGATVDGVRITSAIPAGLRYVAGSATGPGGLVLFSVDGGRTFGTELELAVRGGAPESGGADQTVYTHVRWVLAAPLEVGATGFVRLRALAR